MTKTTTKFGLLGIAALVAVLATSIVVLALSQSAIAAPANKTAFGDDNMVAIVNAATEPGDGEFKTIAYGTIKTSAPSDLLVRHDQECAIHTGLNLDRSNDNSTSAIREEVRLKVTGADGVERYINPVPLGNEGKSMSNGGNENATQSDVAITMCGRALHIDTNIMDQLYELCNYVEGINATDDGLSCDTEDAVFNTFTATKATHGWSWVVTNLGSGEANIEVQSRLLNSLEVIDDGKKTKGPSTDTGTTCENIAEDDCVDTILVVDNKSLIITEEKFSQSVG